MKSQPNATSSQPLSREDIVDAHADLTQMWSAMIDLCKSIPGAGHVLASRSELPPIIETIFEQAAALSEIDAPRLEGAKTDESVNYVNAFFKQHRHYPSLAQAFEAGKVAQPSATRPSIEAVLEQCAGICEHRADEWIAAVEEGSETHGYETEVLRDVAARIRSLKGAL